MIVYAFSLIFPYLLVLSLVLGAADRLAARLGAGANLRGVRRRLMLCALALLIVLIPPKWIPLGRWLFGVTADVSIPLTALLLSRVWEQLSGRRLLDRRDAVAAWAFGLAAGAALYPMALGLGRVDPYVLGWGFSWLHVLVLGVTVALLWMRNRFGIVLVAAVLAYNLGLFESVNLWDYLVDPFYTIGAAGVLACRLVRAAARGRGEGGPLAAAEDARPGG